MTDIVEGLCKAIQDLLVPELKALQVKMEHQAEATNGLRQEMKELRQEMKEMRKDINDIKVVQQEILSKLDVDKRITKLERPKLRLCAR